MKIIERIIQSKREPFENDLWIDTKSNPPRIKSHINGSWEDVYKDSPDVIKYTEQDLTSEQKAQVRNNIGAGTSSFSGNYNNLTNKPNAVLYSSQSLTSAQKEQAKENIGAISDIGKQNLISLLREASYKNGALDEMRAVESELMGITCSTTNIILARNTYDGTEAVRPHLCEGEWINYYSTENENVNDRMVSTDFDMFLTPGVNYEIKVKFSGLQSGYKIDIALQFFGQDMLTSALNGTRVNYNNDTTNKFDSGWLTLTIDGDEGKCTYGSNMTGNALRMIGVRVVFRYTSVGNTTSLEFPDTFKIKSVQFKRV